MYRYFIIYKPYLVLSQFSPVQGKKTLSDLFDVPKDVYPVGRLDFDSEGLLILTNDATLNNKLLHPLNKHQREYWVQVEGLIKQDVIQQLEKGVTISIDGKEHTTQPAKANIFADEPVVPERHPPIRFRQNIPTSWMRLLLIEGKNRQVRRMTAKVGFPTLRLIRFAIEKLNILQMQPGDIIELTAAEITAALFGENEIEIKALNRTKKGFKK